jgi:hypothetical protein
LFSTWDFGGNVESNRQGFPVVGGSIWKVSFFFLLMDHPQIIIGFTMKIILLDFPPVFWHWCPWRMCQCPRSDKVVEETPFRGCRSSHEVLPHLVPWVSHPNALQIWSLSHPPLAW